MTKERQMAQKRTPAEVAALVQRYSDNLVRYAFCIVGEANAAEDIVLSAMADFVYRNEYRALSKAYLWRITYTRSVDYVRRHRRDVPLGDVEEVLTSPCDAEQAAIVAERKRVLYRAMQTLPPDYRNVLYLHVLEGFAVDQTAKIMGKNTKQIYNLLARAKAAMKECLLKEGFDYEDL